MTTYGQKFMAELADLKVTLFNLTHVSYEPGQIKEVLSAAGARTELFLKSVALPGRNSRNSFQWFIDELASVLVSASSRGMLHTLRQAYNNAKHNPAISIPLLEAVQIIEKAHEAVEEIESKRNGSVDSLVYPHTHQVYWSAVWDHYIHGDSEVHLILPCESEHWLGPPTFDIVYVSISAGMM